jgi:hypothetical protein
MFPIRESSLQFFKIADYWSREIVPKASPEELQNVIEVAWWRGDIVGTKSQGRLALLRGLIRTNIIFPLGNRFTPPEVEELEDGTVCVDIRPRVPLPSSDQASWIDEDCVQAFKIIADSWRCIQKDDNFALVAPVMRNMEISRREFQKWVQTRYPRPSFWGRLSKAEINSSNCEAPQLPTDNEVRAMIRTILAENGGFVSQENGAKILRGKYPNLNKKHAMELVKEVTGNEKRGPRGPRNKSAK